MVAEEYVEGLEAVSEKVEVDLWVLQGLQINQEGLDEVAGRVLFHQGCTLQVVEDGFQILEVQIPGEAGPGVQEDDPAAEPPVVDHDEESLVEELVEQPGGDLVVKGGVEVQPAEPAHAAAVALDLVVVEKPLNVLGWVED